jgi:DNA polymerase-1
MKISIDKINSLGIRTHSLINYITNEQRQISKRLNFGLMYSEPIRRFQEHLQIDIETIKSYIDKWWLIYPKITQYIKNVRKQTNINGFCQTFTGRRMFFPELLENSDIIMLDEQKRDILLTFVNSGTAADLLKHSIILITDLVRQRGYDAHIVHTLHDEIIIEVLERDIDEVKIIINDVMTKLAFPEFLECGINIGVDIDVCLWWDKCKDNENTYDFTIDEDDCPNFI